MRGLGRLYREQGDMDSALVYFRSTLSINEIDRERVEVSNSLQVKAGIFRDIDYPRCGQRPLQCLNE